MTQDGFFSCETLQGTSQLQMGALTGVHVCLKREECRFHILPDNEIKDVAGLTEEFGRSSLEAQSSAAAERTPGAAEVCIPASDYWVLSVVHVLHGFQSFP